MKPIFLLGAVYIGLLLAVLALANHVCAAQRAKAAPVRVVVDPRVQVRPSYAVWYITGGYWAMKLKRINTQKQQGAE